LRAVLLLNVRNWGITTITIAAITIAAIIGPISTITITAIIGPISTITQTIT